MSCTTEPAESSRISRIGSWQEPSCTVTFTLTSRTISRAFSSIGFKGVEVARLAGNFLGDLDGDVIGIETDRANELGRAVEQQLGLRQQRGRHFDDVADTQAR